MIKNTDNRKLHSGNRSGFYTVEASLFLPLIILTVLTIGCFLKSDAIWENCMNGLLDECSYSSATASSGPAGIAAVSRVRKRLETDCPELDELMVQGGFGSCSISASLHLALPIGFDRDHEIKGRVKYRDFEGLKYSRNILGSEGLERDESSNAVWIFPQSGTRYHKESCTYVKANVHSCVLTTAIKRKYSPCAMCESGSLPNGSLVFCFSGEDTSYHRGSCRCINRHTIIIDKNEAESRGYRPCSKCGGN